MRHTAHLRDAAHLQLHPEPGGENNRFKWMTASQTNLKVSLKSVIYFM